MKTILVVAEDTPVQRLIKVNLLHNGYGVLQALTGNDALHQVETNSPDLMILDMSLPDMEGFDFLARLKERLNAKSYSHMLPVVALTPAAQDRSFWSDIWDGNGAWLLKPPYMGDLLSRVKRLLTDPMEVPSLLVDDWIW